MSKKKSVLREWIDAIVIAAAIAIFLRTFFFQIYKIPTTSMVPVLRPGDKIFVSKLTYGPKVPFTPLRISGFRKPKRFDIVVFVPPIVSERNKAYIKRLIGLPGDKVEIKDGNIHINGEMVVDPKIAGIYYVSRGVYGASGKETIIPEGKYFFLGDNSYSSKDSRDWGFADEKDIIGKAVLTWWPLKRIAMLE
ncbi:MAG: signal peptidase I [Candidatus Omnitrophica bacterium]|nr:signal peptidase I [Candidatus Omnitrophota bacterium]